MPTRYQVAASIDNNYTCLFIINEFLVKDKRTIKHYQIEYDDGFFIPNSKRFSSLKELIDYYTADANGLCVKLTKIYVQVCINVYITL